MRYALMIYTEPGHEETLSEEVREAAYAEYLALADDPPGHVRWPTGRLLRERADRPA